MSSPTKGSPVIEGEELKSRILLLNKERLKKVVEDNPNTTVYEYSYDECIPIPMCEVRPLLERSRLTFLQWRKEYPEWSDDDIRRRIGDEYSDIKEMWKTHGKLFEFLTSRDTTKEMASRIWWMIHVQECKEGGGIDDGEADMLVGQYLQKECCNMK